MVASKFDNRLKEFGERWEVDRYLSAAGYLSANVKPFFVALPKVHMCSICVRDSALHRLYSAALRADESGEQKSLLQGGARGRGALHAGPDSVPQQRVAAADPGGGWHDAAAPARGRRGRL